MIKWIGTTMMTINRHDPLYSRYRYVTKRVAMSSAEFTQFVANIVMKWFVVASTVLTPVYIIIGRSIMASNLIHTKCIPLSAHHHRSWIHWYPNTRVAVVQSQIKNKSALYNSEYCIKILMCLAMCSNWNIKRELGMAVDATVTPISFKIFNKIRFGSKISKILISFKISEKFRRISILVKKIFSRISTAVKIFGKSRFGLKKMKI